MQAARYKTAASFVAALTVELIGAQAARRQGVTRGDGDRPVPSLAAEAVDLVEIHEPRRLGQREAERVTEPGAKTAVRRLPVFLSGLGREDGRRIAALSYVNAVERVGSVKGADLSPTAGMSGGGDGVSDGGATTRVRDAAIVRLVAGTANRWKFDRERRCYVTGPARVVLAPKRSNSKGRAITALDLLDGLLVHGLSFNEILRGFGWSVHSKTRGLLVDAAQEMVDEITDAMGHGGRCRRS